MVHATIVSVARLWAMKHTSQDPTLPRNAGSHAVRVGLRDTLWRAGPAHRLHPHEDCHRTLRRVVPQFEIWDSQTQEVTSQTETLRDRGTPIRQSTRSHPRSPARFRQTCPLG